jgi:ArsR family transcriptional regulator
MAEALLNHHGSDQFEAHSAGTHPESVHPCTLAALKAHGIEGSRQSKHISEFSGQDFDYVITLCDKATQECKSISTEGKKLEWSFRDPTVPFIDGLSDIERFQSTLVEIHRRISSFISVEQRTGIEEADAQNLITPLQVFKSLSDDLRLRCLMLIQYEGELCVCELMAALEDEQPKVSRHLALLKKSGLLVDRRLGQWMFYRINPALPEWTKSILSQTCDANIRLYSGDIKRLGAMGERPARSKSCCSI